MANPYATTQKEYAFNPEQCTPEREAAVPGAIRSLGFARERLIKMAAELESRLAPVLRADDGSKSDNGAMRSTYCGLEAALQAELYGLESAEAVLAGILHRLEI